MKRILITASAIALFSSASALAQGMPADPAAPAPTADPAAPAPAPGPAMEPGMAPPAEPTMAPPADTTMPPPAAAAPGAGENMPAAAAAAPADWAKFDKGGKGYLTALDFGNWLMAKQGNDMTADVEKTKTSKKAGLPAVKVLNATGSEFLKADKDGNHQVSSDELAAYVAG